MVNRFLKTLTNNIGFKLLAIFLACVLWLVVYNTDDPKVTQKFTTNVTIENGSVITEQNKTYEVLDGTNTVTFSATAKRSILKNMEDTDFIATADLSRMMLEEDGVTANVPIEFTSVRASNSISYPGKRYLRISLEDLMSKRLMVTGATKGTVADGYALGDITVTNPNVLQISGPKSVVDTVATAVATIDVSGMSTNLSDNVVPVLYDEEGEEVDTTRLTISSTTVSINAKILMVTELPIQVATSGEPSGAYSVVGITTDPTIVEVKGSAAVLNPLTSISVPGDLINVQGATDDITNTIDITELLPEGVELVNTSDSKVLVTVRIEKYITKNFSIPTEDIMVNGLGDGLELSYSKSTVTAAISALQSNLEALSGEKLHGTIDVTGLGVGRHQVELVLDLDEENYAYTSMTVEINIEDTTVSENPSSQAEDDTHMSEDKENNLEPEDENGNDEEDGEAEPAVPDDIEEEQGADADSDVDQQ